MKYVLTGSTGNITRPLTQQLVKAGHAVVVITSNPGHADAITQSGAQAAVGSLRDAAFLQQAFAGADAVYLMIPSPSDGTAIRDFQRQVAAAYITALTQSGVKNVVLLSSVGAHAGSGTGPIDGLAAMEEQLKELAGVNVLALRPGYFYRNFFSMIPMIRNAHIMGSNFGLEGQRIPLADTGDIAAAAANALLQLSFKGFGHQYIASDYRTAAAIASTFGAAIGQPNLPWVVFSDQQSEEGMKQAGLPESIVEAYVEMGKAFREGLITEDFEKNVPALAAVRLEDFAKQFAQVYNAS